MVSAHLSSMSVPQVQEAGADPAAGVGARRLGAGANAATAAALRRSRHVEVESPLVQEVRGVKTGRVSGGGIKPTHWEQALLLHHFLSEAEVKGVNLWHSFSEDEEKDLKIILSVMTDALNIHMAFMCVSAHCCDGTHTHTDMITWQILWWNRKWFLWVCGEQTSAGLKG